MDRTKATTLLRDYARSCVKTTQHCRDRMKLRDVTLADIMYVIMWGDVVEVEESPKHKNYKCTVKGTDLDGEELTFIAAIDERSESVLCITVHD